MKFVNLKDMSKISSPELTEELKAGHGFGAVTIGSSHLFIKKGLKTYCIAYADAERIFRRVRRVNAQMCCDNGELELEYLVVSADGRELIEAELPGKKAARMLMDDLKGTAEGVEFGAP
jgi:hypothetical protein